MLGASKIMDGEAIENDVNKMNLNQLKYPAGTIGKRNCPTIRRC